jgi:hypothetical protein
LSAQTPRLTVSYQRDVQDDAVVEQVGIMSMPVPLGGASMDFDGSAPQDSVDCDLGILEIGSLIGIESTRVLNRDRRPGGGLQAIHSKSLSLPDILDNSLRNLERTGIRLADKARFEHAGPFWIWIVQGFFVFVLIDVSEAGQITIFDLATQEIHICLSSMCISGYF